MKISFWDPWALYSNALESLPKLRLKLPVMQTVHGITHPSNNERVGSGVDA